MNIWDDKKSGWGLNLTTEGARPAGTLETAHLTGTEPARSSVRLIVWTMLIALIVTLGIVLGYDYTVLRKHDIGLGQLPTLLESFMGLENRMNAAEARLKAWVADRETLYMRLAIFKREVNADLKRTQEHTREIVAEAQRQLQQELDKRAQAIEARLSMFQSDEQAQREQLTRLEQEVGGIRQEIAAVRHETGQEFAHLDRQQTETNAQVKAVAKHFDPQRVDFEVVKGEARELAPGITVRILDTDARLMRYQGWMWFAPDRRILWIEAQGVQQPVVFRSKQNSEPYELVVTNVTKTCATGYLLVPTSAGSGPDITTSSQDAIVGAARTGS